MRITWYGHACFRFEDDGFSVVTEPYDPDYLELPPIKDEADAVIVSSLDDRGHSLYQAVPGDPVLFNGLDYVDESTTLPNGSELVAVQSWESDRQRPEGDVAKPNAMYLFEVDGVRIGQMGDAGDWLTDEQLETFRGNVDVLIVPAGVKLSIPLDALDAAIEEIGPSVVIPGHVFLPLLAHPFEHVDVFLSRHEGEPILRDIGSSYDVTKDTVPEERTIVVLDAVNGG
jgi:L-ascorbate metabolism protein UlaG (beta-lactamase superfamily)